VICTIAIGEGASFKIREAIASIGDNVVWVEAGGQSERGPDREWRDQVADARCRSSSVAWGS
jgi:hypothetical protein